MNVSLVPTKVLRENLAIVEDQIVAGHESRRVMNMWLRHLKSIENELEFRGDK